MINCIEISNCGCDELFSELKNRIHLAGIELIVLNIREISTFLRATESKSVEDLPKNRPDDISSVDEIYVISLRELLDLDHLRLKGQQNRVDIGSAIA